LLARVAPRRLGVALAAGSDERAPGAALAGRDLHLDRGDGPLRVRGEARLVDDEVGRLALLREEEALLGLRIARRVVDADALVLAHVLERELDRAAPLLRA